MEEGKKICSFQDLFCWKEAHALALMTYKITKNFPKEEMFGLTSQMRRASVSVVSNIAEGYGRPTGKDRIKFFWIAYGSLLELESQIFIAKDLGYIEGEKVGLQESIVKTGKLLLGLIKKTR